MEIHSKNKLIPFFENAKVVAAICLSLFHFIQHSDHTGFLVNQSNQWLQGFLDVLFTTVFVFFVITGYVIPAHLKNTNYQLAHIGQFIFKRILRIYIPFLACIAGYLMLDFLFKRYNQLPFSIEWGRLLANITFTANFTSTTYYNPIFWTLAIEIQFYLFISILFPLLDRIKSPIGFYVLGSITATTGYFWRDNNLLFEYLPMIMSGYFLFLFRSEKITLNTLIALLILQLGVVSITFNPLTSITLGLFFVGFLFQSNRNFFPTFALQTYSFYLFHGLFGGTFLYFTARHVTSPLSIIILLVIAVVLSIFGSWITFYLFEKPAILLVKRLQRNVRSQ